MIILRITLIVLPEKQLEMLQTLRSMIELSKREKGCLNYEVLYDIEVNNRLCLIEEWQSREDLDAHIASRRFGVLLGTTALLSKPIKIQIHTVSGTEGMAAVTAIRNKKRLQKILHFEQFQPRK